MDGRGPLDVAVAVARATEIVCVVVTSAPEGAHVVSKHPAMFQSADLVVLNKTDIARAVNVDLELPERELATLRPGLPVIRTNLAAGEGVEDVLRALKLD